MQRHLLLRFSTWREQQAARLQHFKPVVIGTCSILLVLSLATILWSTVGGSPPSTPLPHAYYYDLNTNELFVHENKLEPPIDAPSGPLSNGGKAGVRAHIFGCGSCDGDVRLAYLSMHRPLTPQEQKLADDKGIYPFTEVIGNPQTLEWHVANSPQAFSLIDPKCENGQVFFECSPTADEIEHAGG